MIATSNPFLNTSLDVAEIALRFARVERITRHEDGVRPETDSDHTVMLSLLAVELAPNGMHPSHVAALATVHDLPEVYAGDTQTLTITETGKRAKELREQAGVTELTRTLGASSRIVALIREYEAQLTPEARFVKLMDKVVVKLTHAFNGCCAAKPLVDQEGFRRRNAEQLAEYREKHRDDPWAEPYLRLLEDAIELANGRWT